jgi:hypothetical protein
MQITLKDFKTFVGEGGLHAAGLHAIERVHGITKKFYCDKLTVRSACSENCESCIFALKTRVRETKWDIVTNKYALFTWIVKDISAKAMEVTRAEEKSKPAKTLFGEPVEGEAFDLFMETIG